MRELSLNILDIVQNSIRAKATEITIGIEESEIEDMYKIVITDDGTGIPEGMLRDITDPYVTTRTKRRMGLGLPLLKYHAELTGGQLTINSEPGKGTEVKAEFSYFHIDRQPLGDITGVLLLLLAANPGINFTYRHKTDIGEFVFSSNETKEYLEVDTLNERILLGQIGCMLNENLKEIGVSEANFKNGI